MEAVNVLLSPRSPREEDRAGVVRRGDCREERGLHLGHLNQGGSARFLVPLSTKCWLASGK